MKSVSVVHSIYGSFDPHRLEAAVLGVQRQDHPSVEVIVSEANEEPRFEDSARSLGVTYRFTPTRDRFNPGAIRNRGLELARTELVYTNDADIVFLEPSFLSDLTEYYEMRGTPLMRPPMVRLTQESFDSFHERIRSDGLETALETLIALNRYQVSTEPTDVTMMVVSRRGRTFTIAHEDFVAYRNDPGLKGFEPTMWFDVVHPGGTFASARELRAVAGYSERYQVWGFEDADLQWKLDEAFGTNGIPDKERLRVLHLDHPKGYFDINASEQNKSILAERKRRGIAYAVAEDTQRGSV